MFNFQLKSSVIYLIDEMNVTKTNVQHGWMSCDKKPRRHLTSPIVGKSTFLCKGNVIFNLSTNKFGTIYDFFKDVYWYRRA